MDCGEEFEYDQVIIEDDYHNPSCPYCGSGDVAGLLDSDDELEENKEIKTETKNEIEDYGPYYVKVFNKDKTDIDTIGFSDEQEAIEYVEDNLKKNPNYEYAIYKTETDECLYVYKKEDEIDLDFEEIVKDSCNHLRDIDKDITIDNLFNDIVNNYIQDYIKDETIRDVEIGFYRIKGVLNRNNIKYINENKEIKTESIKRLDEEENNPYIDNKELESKLNDEVKEEYKLNEDLYDQYKDLEYVSNQYEGKQIYIYYDEDLNQYSVSCLDQRKYFNIDKIDEIAEFINNTISNYNKHIFETNPDRLNKSVKEYYLANYPDEEDFVTNMPKDITFKELYNRMLQGEDVYEILDIRDSVVRERIFDELADSMDVNYDTIYKTWLNSNKKRKKTEMRQGFTFDKYITIKTSFSDDKTEEILESVVGQISDGIWENSRGMDRFWQWMDVYREGNEVVVKFNTSNFESGFKNKDEQQIRKWLANKIKQIVKEEGLEWDRNNTEKCDYLGYKAGVTVQDAYRVYDRILGRKDRITLDDNKDEDKLEENKESKKLYIISPYDEDLEYVEELKGNEGIVFGEFCDDSLYLESTGYKTINELKKAIDNGEYFIPGYEDDIEDDDISLEERWDWLINLIEESYVDGDSNYALFLLDSLNGKILYNGGECPDIYNEEDYQKLLSEFEDDEDYDDEDE